MAMLTKVISVTEPQDVYLRAEAKRLGITVADLIRRILDTHRDKEAAK